MLENAIYHGIEPLTDGGTIEIEGRLDNKKIVLAIRNPLNHDSSQQIARGNQLAQDNIRERLAALHGKRCNLQIEAEEHHYQVTISFPYQNEYEDPDRR